MSVLKQQERKVSSEVTTQPPTYNNSCDTDTDPAAAAVSTAPQEMTRGGVVVTSSIHTGRYPIVGLTVAQARKVLGPMMNLNPEAVAVIAGAVVDNEDERKITGQDKMIHFVKPSSMKG